MITCPKCAKDNQDHYKFCLGCGAELPPDPAPKPFAPSPPSPVAKKEAPSAPAAVQQAPVYQPVQQAPVPRAAVEPAAPAVRQPVAAPPPPAGMTACPQCGHENASNNLFCGACGFRLNPPASVAQPPSPPPAAVATAGVTLTALRADGSEAGSFTLPGGTNVVGRETGGIFAGDSYLSPRHATFRQTGGKVTVKDESSLNGVYKKLTRDVPVEVRPNDVFRVGQEIIKYEPLAMAPPSPDGVERLGSPSKGYLGRIALVIGRDTTGNAFPIPESGIHLGRERGDVLFPEDGYVSGLHCRLSWENDRLTLTDLGSSNGSFIRLREEAEVRSGDVLLMGQQLFRITT